MEQRWVNSLRELLQQESCFEIMRKDERTSKVLLEIYRWSPWISIYREPLICGAPNFGVQSSEQLAMEADYRKWSIVNVLAAFRNVCLAYRFNNIGPDNIRWMIFVWIERHKINMREYRRTRNRLKASVWLIRYDYDFWLIPSAFDRCK